MPADLASVLKALVDALNALVAALGQPPVAGGGGIPPSKDPGGYGSAQLGIRKP